MAAYNRLLIPPSQSFFLFGMRGVGKTSWSCANFTDAQWFNLLDERLFQSYLADPGLFGGELRRIQARQWVVIDEVQRLPNLLNEVHRAIEEQKLRFVLLGSSARKLRRAGVNLLGGRALKREMYPLLPSELASDFKLEEALRYGTLPLVVTAPNPAEQLEAYVQLYLKEEIQNEALVRNLPAFARFFPVAALFHGQVINTSGLGRDAGVNRTTVEGYLQILEDTLLAFRLPAYEGRLRVKERKHPKLYWIDAGVIRAAKRHLHPPSQEERGALFEGFIAMILRAARDLKICEFDELYYWAPSQGSTEVDFIMTRGKEVIALEVKASKKPSSQHFAGLRAVKDLKGVKKRILIHLGERSFRTEDKIDALTFQEFYKELMGGTI